MGLQHVIPQIQADARARVQADMWGHLAPKPRTAYRGTILFTHSEYGDMTLIRTDFGELPSSPWFYEDMTDFMFGCKTVPGGIYEWEGTYTKRKNGTCHFKGRTVERMPPLKRAL